MHTFTKHPIRSSETLLGRFDNRETYDIFRYADAKLAVNAFTRKLATAVSSNYVIVNNLCPGMVATGFDKGLPAWIRLPFIFIRAVVARKVDEGSRTLVYAAAVAGPESHGKFLNDNKIERQVLLSFAMVAESSNMSIRGAPFLDEAEGKKFVEQLWTEVVEDVKTVDPTIEIGI